MQIIHSMNYTRFIFTIFLAGFGILVFATWNNNIYAQQLYSPPPTSIAPVSPTPLSQLPQQTNNSNGNGNGNGNSTNVPIVLRPLPGGTCTTGYHLVSGSVCIKDLPSAAPQSPTTTNNATKSFSIPPSPLLSTRQPNVTNPTNNDNNSANANNEENFSSKILKSFNQESK